MKTTRQCALLGLAVLPLLGGCVETRVVPVASEPATYQYDQAPPPAAPPPEPAPVAMAPAVEPMEAPPAPDYVGAPPVEATYFYNDLTPYGTWVALPNYGWCWQPTTVALNPAWRPYSDGGHWVWTDAGWYWASDYSWGWAPFHYGRWFLHERCGWVWLPDRVWGPAWVTWRSAGDNCGWAPLPPHADFDARLGWRFNGVRVAVDFDFGLRPEHFTFIGLDHFRDRDLGHRRMAPVEVTRIYNRTTIINNYTVNNTTIVNRGIAVERVAAATHTQIRPATVRELPAGAPRGTRAAGADRSETVVYRAPLQAPARATGMVAQKLDERHPVIQHPSERATIPGAKPAPHNNATGPGVVPRTQAEAPKAPVRPAQEPAVHHEAAHTAPTPPAVLPPRTPARPAADSSVATRPAPVRPAPVARPVPPASRTVEDAKLPTRGGSPSRPTPAVTPPPAPVRTVEAPKPAARPTPEVRTEPAPRPARAVAAAQPPAGKPTASDQNPHVYLPKSAHQAAEAHALPSANPRPLTPAASPSKDTGAESRRGDNRTQER